jgi:hypothetical protein
MELFSQQTLHHGNIRTLETRGKTHWITAQIARQCDDTNCAIGHRDPHYPPPIPTKEEVDIRFQPEVDIRFQPEVDIRFQPDEKNNFQPFRDLEEQIPLVHKHFGTRQQPREEQRALQHDSRQHLRHLVGRFAVARESESNKRDGKSTTPHMNTA